MDSAADMDAYNLRRDEFESIKQRRKSNLRGRVLVPYYHDALALKPAESPQFEAVPDQADVAFVWVKEVHRPVFCLSPVISKRPYELEL